MLREMKAFPCLISCLVIAVVGPVAIAEETEFIPKGSSAWREAFDPPFHEPSEVSRESGLRKTLFDLLRPGIEKQAGEAVLFEGSVMAYRNWAIFVGRTLDKAAGNSIAFKPQGNDDTVAIWLRTREGWRLVDYEAGHSDVFYVMWHEQYGVPKALLGLGG